MEIAKSTKYVNTTGLKNVARTTNILRNFNIDKCSSSYDSSGVYIRHIQEDAGLDPMPYNVERDWSNTTTTKSTFLVHAGVVGYNVWGNWADLPTEVDSGADSRVYDDYKSIVLDANSASGTYYFVLRPNAAYIPTKVVPSLVTVSDARDYVTQNCTTSLTYTSDDIGRSREELVIASVAWDADTCVATELQQLSRGWNMQLGDKTNTDNHRCEYYWGSNLFYHGGRWFWEYNGTKKVLNNVAGSLESYQQMTQLTLSNGENYVVAILDNRYQPTNYLVEIQATEPLENDDYPPEKVCIARVTYDSATAKCTGLYQYVCGDIRTSFSSFDDLSIDRRVDGTMVYKWELHGWLAASAANAVSMISTDLVPFKRGDGDGVEVQYGTISSIANAAADNYSIDIVPAGKLAAGKFELKNWCYADASNASSVTASDVIPFKYMSGDGVDLRYCKVSDIANTGTVNITQVINIVSNNFCTILTEAYLHQETPDCICTTLTDECGFAKNHTDLADDISDTMGDRHHWVGDISGGNYSYLGNMGSYSRNGMSEGCGDSNGAISVAVNSRYLALANTVDVLNWGTQIANDATGVNSIRWTDRELLDSTNGASIDYGQRICYASGNPIIEWGVNPVLVNAKLRVTDTTAGNDLGGALKVDGGIRTEKACWVESGGAYFWKTGGITGAYVGLASSQSPASAAIGYFNDGSESVKIFDGTYAISTTGPKLIQTATGYQTDTFVGSTVTSNLNLVTNDGTLVPVTIRGGLVVVT